MGDRASEGRGLRMGFVNEKGVIKLLLQLGISQANVQSPPLGPTSIYPTRYGVIISKSSHVKILTACANQQLIIFNFK